MKKTQIFPLGLLLFLSIGACSPKPEVKQGGSPAVPVTIKTLENATLINSSEYVANLEATSLVNLAPQIDGRILKVAVSNGSRVSQGQLIVQLEATQKEEDVKAATSVVNSKKADLERVEAEYRQRQAEKDGSQIEISRRRSELAKAESDIQARIADLESKEAGVTSQKAQLELAKKNFERTKFLVDKGALSAQELDNKKRDLATKEADLKAAIKVRDAAMEAVKASRSVKESAREAVVSAQENMKAAQERIAGALASVSKEKAGISEAEAKLASINQNLVFNSVVAPVSGIVGEFPVKVGDYVNRGQVLTTITSNKNLEININLPVEKIDLLKIGTPVELVNKNTKIPVTGTINYIAPNVNKNAQTVLTKAVFANDKALRNAQFVRVRIIWDQKPGVLVPTEAISRLGAQNFVFVAEEGKSQTGEKIQIAKQKPVQLGQIQGQNYQVISGVKAGDKLIVDGILKLRDQVPIAPETVKSELKQPN